MTCKLLSKVTLAKLVPALLLTTLILLMNTKIVNAYVVCVDKSNRTKVLPCSDNDAIDNSTNNVPANIISKKQMEGFGLFGNLSEPMSVYQNKTYGIKVQYPSGWIVEQSNISSVPITIAAFFSLNGNPKTTAEISIYMEKLNNSTTILNHYAHYSLSGYEYLPAFKLIKLSTNTVLSGSPAYELIGTYEDPASGFQKLMEIGTIIGANAYVIQFISDAPRYFDYLPIAQKMINSLQIKPLTSHIAASLAAPQMQGLYPTKEKKSLL
jgi:hypothetical protein